MKNNTVLYEESISSIRGQDVDIVLNMGNSISWTINGSNIVADEANGIDMGVTIGTGNIPSGLLDAVKGNDENNTVIELTLSHDGTFDFAPILTINTAKDNAGRIANLFYYNPDSSKLEFVDAVEVTQTGDISFTFTHASDYAVIISDSSMAELASIDGTVASGDDSADIEAISTNVESSQDAASGKINPRMVAVIVVIVLVCAAAGVTAFLLFRRKDDEDFEDEEDTSDTSGNGNATPDSLKIVSIQSASSDKISDEETYDENEEDAFIDDYREPEVNTKKTGKVISIKKLKDQTKKDDTKQTGFDDDEFDGFE